MRAIAIAAAILLTLPSAAVSAQQPALLFGVVPQQAASQLARLWMPLTSYLSRTTGREIRFATAKDIPTFESCLAKRAYDIAYMNPYHYVIFREFGYDAIARERQNRLQGLLVTAKDSPIQSLSDLSGQTVAFPSPAAFAASVLPRAEMTARGIPFNPAYVKSHDSVYLGVAEGLFVAGGGIERTWNTLKPEVRDKLRIFYSTIAYMPHPITVQNTVDPALRAKIVAALEEVSEREPALVEALGMIGFESGKHKDWDDVRALGLTREQTDVIDEAGYQCRSD